MSSTYQPVHTSDDAESGGTMQESLVGAPPEAHGIKVAGVPQIEVEAPTDLPEGYEFRCTVGSQSILVQVPPGGVEKGQKWTVPLPSSSTSQHQHVTSIPVGHWRDSVAGIFNYGLCHPHCWTAVLCSLLAGGQVIRRLQFTWRGTPSPNAAASARAFDIIFYITVFHWFMFGFLYLAIWLLDPKAFDEPTRDCLDAFDQYEHDYEKLKEMYPECIDEPEGLLLAIIILFQIFKYMYMVITIWLLYSLRRSVRTKYAIPGTPHEDCCWSFWCPCLVAGQLLRHTTDYDVYPSQLCTDTGLPANAPAIV